MNSDGVKLNEAKKRKVLLGMININKLQSGYFYISGNGPCNWTQPPCWPCTEDAIRDHAFPEASESFLGAVICLSRTYT